MADIDRFDKIWEIADEMQEKIDNAEYDLADIWDRMSDIKELCGC